MAAFPSSPDKPEQQSPPRNPEDMVCHLAAGDPASQCPAAAPLHSRFCMHHTPFLKTRAEPFWVRVHARRKRATLVLSFLGSVNNSAGQRICLAIPSVAQLSILYSSSMNEPNETFICILFKLPSTASMRPLEVCCESSRAKIF